MKHTFFALLLAIVFNNATYAQKCNDNTRSTRPIPSEKDMAGYVMVYHKDADHGLHMAYSWDGFTWTALNDDRPIMAGDTIAVQHGIRDPYIFRGPDGGFCVAMTDLHVFGQRDGVRTTEWERDGRIYDWGNNRGLVLLKSFDLIHWRRTNLDFSALTCPTGEFDDEGHPISWKDVGCVWAPEMITDPATGHILMHFTTRFFRGRNHIRYVLMNDAFDTMLSAPRFLFGAPCDDNGHLTNHMIDSDITLIDGTYHLFSTQSGHPRHSTSTCLAGPYTTDYAFSDSLSAVHEAPMLWKLIGQDRWILMQDRYSMQPHNFYFCETTDLKTFHPLGYFDEPGCPMRRTNFSEQKHGAVVHVTRDELQRLIDHWKGPAVEDVPAQNPVRGTYGYLYCHMGGDGEYTAYAISRDGLHFEDVMGGKPVFDPQQHARIEGGTRDAYIARSHDAKGYRMVTTDMCVARSKVWDNYGIDLLRSDDLLTWESVTFDFRRGSEIFCDPESPDVYRDWSKVNRVWAPQFVWDPNYVWADGSRGGYFVYYSMWNSAEEPYDRMYYSYADASFTRLTKPRLLFDWGYATIDADINYLESDGLYHMLIKKEGGKPGIYTATAKSLTGPWGEPVENDYVSFEGNKKCEGCSAFQLVGDDGWVVAYIQYSTNPKHYRLCRADRNLRNFRDPVDIEGVRAPQHGSFMRLTKKEYKRLTKMK